MVKQPRELQKLKEEVFRDFVTIKAKEKNESIEDTPTKKAIATAIAKKIGLADYSSLYRLIYKLDF